MALAGLLDGLHEGVQVSLINFFWFARTWGIGWRHYWCKLLFLDTLLLLRPFSCLWVLLPRASCFRCCLCSLLSSFLRLFSVPGARLRVFIPKSSHFRQIVSLLANFRLILAGGGLFGQCLAFDFLIMFRSFLFLFLELTELERDHVLLECVHVKAEHLG